MSNGPTAGVYFLRARESGRIKIGFSTDAPSRIRQLQTGSPERLELLRVLPAGADLERALHIAFAVERQHNEWFAPSSRLLAYIAGTDWHVFEADAAPPPWDRAISPLPQLHAADLNAKGAIDFVTLYRYAFDCFGLGPFAYRACANAWLPRLPPPRHQLARRTYECLLCDGDGPWGHADNGGALVCPLVDKLRWLPPPDHARAVALLTSVPPVSPQLQPTVCTAEQPCAACTAA